MIYPDRLYMVFDLDNGDMLSKRYVWYFSSKAKALKHIRAQRAQLNSARLSDPVLYVLGYMPSRIKKEGLLK